MQAWEELEYAKDDAREEGRKEGLKQGQTDIKKDFIRYLLRQNKPDSEIQEIVGCDQTLIDKVRNEGDVN